MRIIPVSSVPNGESGGGIIKTVHKDTSRNTKIYIQTLIINLTKISNKLQYSTSI